MESMPHDTDMYLLCTAHCIHVEKDQNRHVSASDSGENFNTARHEFAADDDKKQHDPDF